MKSKLKKYRLLARLTQTEVAKAVGVSQPTYQRWESGSMLMPEFPMSANILVKFPSILPAAPLRYYYR